MASSTTKPMESTIPRRVSTLMEKSIKYMIKNTPMSEIGIVTTGIKVVRQSRKKRKIIATTSINAVMMVSSTSEIDWRMY